MSFYSSPIRHPHFSTSLNDSSIPLARSTYLDSATPQKTSILGRHHDSVHVVDRQLQNIKSSMDNEHRRKIHHIMSDTSDIDKRNNLLEHELRKLNDEIIIAKTVQGNNLKDKDLQRQLHDRQSVSKIDKIKLQTHQKLDQIQFEINKIKDELNSSTLRANEFRRKATEFESRSLLLSRSETRLRDYEERLNNITHDVHAKQAEIDNVKGQISALQLKGGDIIVLEREIQNLKTLLVVKERENEVLRKRKGDLETEIFKNQQSEKNLRGNEIDLMNTAENLRLKIANVESQKNQEILQREKHYENQISLNDRTHQIEVDRLRVQLENLESELNLKSGNLDRLRAEHAQIQNSLSVAQVRTSSAEKEANLWHHRANSAEIVKERESRMHRAMRESAIDNTIKQHSSEKLHLESQANNLSQVLNVKEHQLTNAKRSLIDTDIAKSQIQATNHVLESKVNETIVRLDSSREKYLRESYTKDVIHESSLERLRHEHQSKRVQLEDQINALRSLVQVKRRELDEANRKTVQASVEINQTELRKSQAEAARNYWTHKAVEVEHVKNSQILAHEHAKNHDISLLQNSHFVDMSLKEREHLGLNSAYQSQDRENVHLRISNADLQSKVLESSVEQVRALTESEIWRQRSLEAEANRINNNIAHNNLRNSLVHNTELHHSVEQNHLVNVANHTAVVNTVNALEANHMRNSYVATASLSPVRYIPHVPVHTIAPSAVYYQRY